MAKTSTGQFSQRWRCIFIIGGATILVAMIFFRRNYSAELEAFNGFGIFNIPDTQFFEAADWLQLMVEDPYIGLSLLGFWDIFNYALLIVVFIALFGGLKEHSRTWMGIAVLGLITAFLIFTCTNPAFGLLRLSSQFANTAVETQRALILAEAEALLTPTHPGDHNPGIGYNLSSFLFYSSGLIAASLMVRSSSFSRFTAISGTLANGIGLVYFILLLVGSPLYWIPPTLSAPFRLIWYIMISKSLFQLGKTK